MSIYIILYFVYFVVTLSTINIKFGFKIKKKYGSYMPGIYNKHIDLNYEFFEFVKASKFNRILLIMNIFNFLILGVFIFFFAEE